MPAESAGRVSPALFTPVLQDRSKPPRLCLVVDTEEEFDWSAPFSRDNVDVSAIAEVGRLQTVVGRYGLKPTYAIDYPVASTPSSAARLAELAARGECHIGAHLHPWVNPPYAEQISLRTSYACNLGVELEGEKIETLQAAIATRVGVKARSYKAGRYGFGASTAVILERLGFDVDLSVNPHMDFTGDGGPSFRGFTTTPATFGTQRRLLEVPCTTGFIGRARRIGPELRRAASARWLEPFRAVGVLARSGLLNRVMLSPEGNTLGEMQDLTNTLLAEGLRTFSLTLHSPSLKPGCTPYVRSVQERDDLLETIDRYCEYFMGQQNGVPSTPMDVFSQLEGRAA
ncbi:MAG: polysaccharide deacetylase family protein [Vicinamibacterales bacterium]